MMEIPPIESFLSDGTRTTIREPSVNTHERVCDLDAHDDSVCAHCSAIPWEILSQPLYDWDEAEHKPVASQHNTSVATECDRDEKHEMIEIDQATIIKAVKYDLTAQEQEDNTFLESLKTGSIRSMMVAKVALPSSWPGDTACRICCTIRKRLSKEKTRHPILSLQQCASSRNDVPCTGLVRLNTADPYAGLGWDLLATSLSPEVARTTSCHLVPFDLDYSSIRACIECCACSHVATCGPKGSGGLRNLAVIDCERRIVVPAPMNCEFAALSYVWGLLVDQQEASVQSLDAEVPRTIEDGIAVALQLGYKYLWVDRYCIDQGDEAEALHQIEQMADIYAAAQITIVAAAGEDPSYGLPGVSKSRTCIGNVRNVHLFWSPPVFFLNDAMISKWFNRAWTFQECYFSRRRLIFTDYQMIYMCNQKTTSEKTLTGRSTDVPLSGSLRLESFVEHMKRYIPGSPASAGVGQLVYHDSIAQMLKVLSEYSRRQLTYDRDALNAILGTLRTFKSWAIDHWWGVLLVPAPWRSADIRNTEPVTFHGVSLLWRSHFFGLGRRPGFPSWSQIGWRNSVLWFWRHRSKDGNFFVDPSSILINEMHVNPILASTERFKKQCSDRSKDLSLHEAAEQNAMVEYNSQYLEFSGPTLDLHLAPRIEGFRCVSLALNDQVDLFLVPDWDLEYAKSHVGQRLTGILVNEANGPDSSARSESDLAHFLILAIPIGDHYERVGIIHLPQDLAMSSLARPERSRWNVEISFCHFRFRFTDDTTGRPVWEELVFDCDTETLGFANRPGVKPRDDLKFSFREEIHGREPEFIRVTDRSNAGPLDTSQIPIRDTEWWRKYCKHETIILG